GLWLLVVGVRPGRRDSQLGIAFLSERAAEAVAGEGPDVLAVGDHAGGRVPGRFLVDLGRAVVEEGERRHVAVEDLHARDDVAQFALPGDAGVAGRFTHRVGSHAVRAAER